MTHQPPSSRLTRRRQLSPSQQSVLRPFGRKLWGCAIIAALLIGEVGINSAPATAQENPFGGPGVEVENPFGGGGAAAAATKQTIKLKSSAELAVDEFDTARRSDSLLIRSVGESNPQTPVELAKAVSIMINIEQFGEAKGYLTRLIDLKLDPKATYDLFAVVGADFFYTLNGSDEMAPEGKTYARAALSAAKAFSESPARVNQLIKTLSDENMTVRSEAFNKLRRLGPNAAAAIINVFADDSRKEEFAGLRGALYSFGDSAVAPLAGAARSPNSTVSTEAVRAITKYSTPEALDVLMRSYLSSKVSQPARMAAMSVMMKRGITPDQKMIENRLAERSEKFLRGSRISSDSFLDQVTFWSWDDAAKKLVAKQVDLATAARIRAAQRAADLYEINPTKPRNRERYLLTEFEAAKRIAGASNPSDTDALIKRVSQDLPITATEVEAILLRAMELDYIPAAITCCEVLKEIGNDSQVIGDTRPRPLVQAILAGDRHLQFAALDAITTINPSTAYAGSSYVSELAAFLSRSSSGTSALVGHIRPSVAQSYAGTLATLGIEGVSASSSREFFEKATANPDIAMLMVTDTLDRPYYAELIQQLRNDWRTKRIPIALLVSKTENMNRMDKIVGKVDRLMTFPMSTTPSVVAGQVVRLNSMVQPLAVSPDDRYRHARVSTKWLVKVATDPTYSFYNLRSHQEQLVRLMYIPEFANDAAKILSELGTPRAQRELINFASQSGLPLESRKIVVEAFNRSVKRQGTLLTTHEIQQQYDRYNASETEPKETQKVLGSILDTIEARRKALDASQE